jgi:DNA-binding transcriptional MerR regulator
MDEDLLSISELAETVGVSVRTIRYYIAEGLLPPPLSAGPGSHYSQMHIERLREIAELKAAFLPLKEIRRLLPLREHGVISQEVSAEPSSPAPGAVAFLAHEPVSEPSAPAPPAETWRDSHSTAAEYLAELRETSPAYARALARERVRHRTAHESPVVAEASPVHDQGGSWRRLTIGDDAELLVREEVYVRRRDKIEWLIDWARRVLD